MSRVRTPGLVLTLCAATVAAACVRAPGVVRRPPVADDPMTFTLVGQFSIPPRTRVPPVIGLWFGGISGLAATAAGAELFGVSDDHRGARVYRFRITGEGDTFRVETVEEIPLSAPAGGPADMDPEGIALLPNGHLLMTSEGLGNVEPRIPPALVEFSRYGEAVRVLPLRERYVPNPTGPLVKGVRPNIGLESLTIVPGGDVVFTATEAALVQDGDLATFERGTPARLMEYVRHGDSYTPRREFVYMVEPVHRPPFEPGTMVNGLVELLALDGHRLLALERSFVREAGDAGRDMNRIRVFQIALAGATDVSGADSLREAPGFTPVTKTLLLDLSDVPGLSARLAPSLDNFEGLAFGAPLADGRPTLIMVSDDNFNPAQRTWFLQFACGAPGGRARIQ
jgi:3-phytase